MNKDFYSVSSLVFAWPSSGKRNILLESIESHAENLRRYGRTNSLLFSIDGKRSSLDSEIHTGLKELSKKYPQQFHILDCNTRKNFLENLPGHIDKEAATHALFPPLDTNISSRGPGYNRNMLFLATAGNLLVESDDDILCAPASCNKTFDEPKFSSETFPLSLRFYTDRTALLSEITATNVDIAEQHLQYLGKTASEYFGDDHVAAKSKILLTCAGYYGDSGFGRARTILALKDQMRLHMLKQGYEETRYSREVTRIPDRDIIGPSMVFMAGHSGYDVREYLPPFFPFVGNEDGFFTMLVRVCNPNSLTAFPSFGLLHNPPENRPHTRESLIGFKPYITELLMALTLACMPDNSITDARSRMIQLGHNYEEVSCVSNSDFVELLHHCWSQGAMAYAEDLESLLCTHNRQPVLWATDVDELLENIYTMLREPLNLFGSTGCGLKVEQVTSLLKNYGSLLTVWPDMLDFATKNNSMHM